MDDVAESELQYTVDKEPPCVWLLRRSQLARELYPHNGGDTTASAQLSEEEEMALDEELTEYPAIITTDTGRDNLTRPLDPDDNSPDNNPQRQKRRRPSSSLGDNNHSAAGEDVSEVSRDGRGMLDLSQSEPNVGASSSSGGGQEAAGRHRRRRKPRRSRDPQVKNGLGSNSQQQSPGGEIGSQSEVVANKVTQTLLPFNRTDLELVSSVCCFEL